MMKRKGLSVAVSVALATVSLLPAAGYAVNTTIHNGQHDHKSTFDNNDRVTVTDGGTQYSEFKGNAKQSLIGTSSAGDSTSANDAFSGNAVQAIHIGDSKDNTFTDNTIQYVAEGNSNSYRNRFSGHSTQYLLATNDHSAGDSTLDIFDGNSTQSIDGGVAKNARFSDNAQQYVAANKQTNGYRDSISRNSHFSGHSSQVINSYDSEGPDFKTGGPEFVHYQGRSEGDTFNDNAAQTLKGTGISTNAIFNNNAVQNLNGTGTSTHATFNDNAGQIVKDAGISSGSVFNGHSIFEARSGEMKNATLNDSAVGYLGENAIATGTTAVNNHATLLIAAQHAFSAPVQQNAEAIAVNGGTLRIIDSTGASHTPATASVGHLTVNQGTVSFGDTVPDSSGQFTGLNVGTMDGPGGTLIFNSSLAAGKSNLLTADTIGSGHYNLLVNDATASKDVTLNTLIQASQLEVLHVTKPGGNHATYNLTDINGKKIDNFDLGLHLGTINTDDKGNVHIVPIIDKTTRSTDALLGALSSGLFISDGEMQNVRSRRGELQNGSQDDGGAWGRYLNDNTHVSAAGTAGYRLEQNGMELGGDKIFNVGNDRLALGLFGNSSKNNLKQDRGNSSSVESWGTGVYATWFGAQGYYVDGVMKYNHFSTDVRSRTETGQAVSGKFNQNGLGASLETGYRFTLPADMFVEPYIRAAYFTTDGKDVALSNGLEAKADRLQSIRGETGVSAGKRFDLNGGMTVSPYVTVAVEQEFDKSNNVRVNDADNFNNDFSGTTGRYGLGVTSQITRNASVYAEANYRKGEHVESPVMGNAGFRVNF